MSDVENDPDDRVRDALEARLVQEEAEAAAEQLHRNTRTLGELLLDWSDAGYQVSVRVGSHTWTGTVLASASTDEGLLVLDTGSAIVEVALGAIAAAEQSGREPGGTRRPVDSWIPATLVARLRWCLTQDPPPEVRIGNDIVDLIGVVVAVASTHVEVASGGRCVALVPSFVECRAL